MTTMHEPFEELAAVYAVGALDGQDLLRFEAHLAAGCNLCTVALRDYHETLAQAAGELRVTPPPSVRSAVLAHISAKPARRPLRLGALALAAGIGALAIGLIQSVRYERRLHNMASELATLRSELAEDSATVALLSDPATRVVALAGLAPSPEARARVVWRAEERGFLVVNGLPPVPAGKVYELWAIASGRPIPAGLFSVDERGVGRLRLPPLPGVSDVDKFAVTLEPAGGTAEPTGMMYLLG